MPSKDPKVQKKARDKWYRLNKKKQIARQYKRRLELKEWFWDYKRTLACSDCGFSFRENPECCDFHHLDQVKKKNPVGIQILSSKKAMFREIEKCIPVCVRCHRIRHRNMYTFA